MRDEVWNEVRDKVRKKSLKEMALRMLQAKKYTLKEIADIAEISLKEVKKLQTNFDI